MLSREFTEDKTRRWSRGTGYLIFPSTAHNQSHCTLQSPSAKLCSDLLQVARLQEQIWDLIIFYSFILQENEDTKVALLILHEPPVKPKSCSESLMAKLGFCLIWGIILCNGLATEDPVPLRGAGTLNLPFSPACPFSLHYKDWLAALGSCLKLRP